MKQLKNPLTDEYYQLKNLVLGKRDDFTKTNANEMLQKGKQLNNFYVAVIEIDRVRGKDYNSASVHLVTGFKDENGKPFILIKLYTPLPTGFGKLSLLSIITKVAESLVYKVEFIEDLSFVD